MPIHKYFLAFFLLPLTLFAQQETVVDTVVFKGIKKNKIQYLELFVQHSRGSILDSIQLKKEVQTLQNLPSLFYVQSRFEKKGEKNILIFDCEEAHTFLPFINFGGGENKESVSFQIGASEYNLFGRGIQIHGYYQYKEKHTFVLSTRNPYLFSSSWGLALGGKKWTTNEPLYFQSDAVRYQYDNYYLEATGIKTFSYGHYFEFGGALFQEIYTKLDGENAMLGPQELTTYKYLGKLNYQYERINYFYHYKSGYSFSSNFSTVATDGMDDIFIQGDFVLKYHKRIQKRGNLSFRFGAGLTTNANSPFAAYVLDSQTNLRGIGDRTNRGTGITYLNTEYSQTLLDKKWFALLATGFLDLAKLRSPGHSIEKTLKEDNLNAYAGIGGKFLLKKVYNAVFRIDFGHSIYNSSNNEIVIGLGHYF